MQYYVYILTNKPRGVLYIGVTNDLERRVLEHRSKSIAGFTKRYNLTRLVYFESSENIESAIEYEKKLKNWHRVWKIDLIEKHNPEWRDLFPLDPESSSG